MTMGIRWIALAAVWVLTLGLGIPAFFRGWVPPWQSRRIISPRWSALSDVTMGGALTAWICATPHLSGTAMTVFWVLFVCASFMQKKARSSTWGIADVSRPEKR